MNNEGNACPRCGTRKFRIDVTFAEDDESDMEMIGPAECRGCGWQGPLNDLVDSAELKQLKKKLPGGHLIQWPAPGPPGS